MPDPIPSFEDMVEIVTAIIREKEGYEPEVAASAILNAVLPLVLREPGEALERSEIALNDWCVTYASDLCDDESVKKAWTRIRENAGTLSYIAHLTSDIGTTLAGIKALAKGGG